MTTLPAGWKLVPERATQAMEDAWDATPANEDINAEFHAAYAALLDAAPTLASVAPGDAQDEDDVLSWLEVEIGALSCRYYGDPSYDHDAYWMRDRVLKLIEDARRAFCTPAAGDALAALRELVACDNLKKQIASMQVCVMETDDDVQELDAMMSDLARRQPAAWDAARAALAAQVPQQGEA
ncbi:hypothetical protein [Achromobacter denitrificans]|uniref:hypothetical protein n=1 Tax=Achromobacter denitrificans TaxID=32002 RepID=UPI003CFDD307